MTIADQITAYLETRLALIREGNSITLPSGFEWLFACDAGASVFVNLEYQERPEEMPALVLYVGKGNSSQFGGVIDPEIGMEAFTRPISIEGFISCDKRGSEGWQLLSDIAAAVKSDQTCGGLIDLVDGWETDMAIQDDENVFAVVSVKFNAIYQVPIGTE